MRIDRVCMLLRDTEFALRKKASKAITSELENGNPQPDIKSTTKMLSLLSRLYSVFDNIRSCSPASDKVITSNVVHEANGVRRIDLCWMQRLPDVVSCAPLLIIDATADEKISRLPLAGRDAFYGEDVGKEIEFKRIKVDAPHMTLVKVIDAPYTKTALKPKAHEITVGEDGEHVARRALHGNSSLASVLRVADAICGRTVADGGTTGLITFKAVREDITERGADEDLILGHLGKTRGLNCMENTSSIFIAGRIALGIDKLEKLTCAIFGLDPEGEEPTLGLGMNYRAEAVLRARGADGRSLGNGLSIRTEAPRCRVVKRVSDWITLAEELQAIHRGRGVRRTAADPVLVVVMSNVVGDITCDHVVTWDAFANMRALDALMHSAGVVNRRPAHLKALKPQLFQWLVTDAVIAWDLFNAWDVTKMSKHRKSLKPCTIT